MVKFAIFFALGCLLLQQQAYLPEPAWLILPAFLLLMLAAASRIARIQPQAMPLLISILACSAGYMHAGMLARERFQDFLPAAWQGRDIQVNGVIAEMPRLHERGKSFLFKVDGTLTPGVHVPQQILLATYNNIEHPAPDLHAGERWQLTVRLKQPHGTYNPHAFDFEAWAIERNIRATGYINNNADNRMLEKRTRGFSSTIESWREAIRDRFRQHPGTQRYADVLAALAIGDQSGIPATQWQVFTRTGINHLMSISGLHITMLASLVFFLTLSAWRRIPPLALRFPAYKAAALAGLMTAIAYALLSGFGIPAQRTVYMLATFTAGLLLAREFFPAQLLAAALLAVMLLDPWAVNSPGFWLSYAAVALIFYISANRPLKSPWIMQYANMQMAMSLGLVPLLLILFQQFSLVSPVANAVAVPLVSFIVVPLVLLAVIPAFDWLLYPAHALMQLLMQVLQWLNDLPASVWQQHAPPAWSLAFGLLGMMWLFMPKGFPGKWASVVLLLPMFMIEPAKPQFGEARIAVFDVGQGLAVAVQTQSHALLYDSGPAYGSESDSGSRILIPALRGMGLSRLDMLILTHDDQDHTGGALSVMHAIEPDMLLSSLPLDSPIVQAAKNPDACHAGQHWNWDGVHFEILHPAASDYGNDDIKHNDMGCVLRISGGSHVALLTADIEKKSEQRLLQRYPDKLKADLLVVPHHGSKTSSTAAFIAEIRPRYAIIPAGYRNRFGHPRADVVERYIAAGSEILRSDRDGAILASLNNQELTPASYRSRHARYWLHRPETAEITGNPPANPRKDSGTSP